MQTRDADAEGDADAEADADADADAEADADASRYNGLARSEGGRLARVLARVQMRRILGTRVRLSGK